MSEPATLLVWRKPAIGWCIAGIALGTAIIAAPALLPKQWLPLGFAAADVYVMAAFGVLWMGFATALCALKGRGRAGLTRGDVVVCFPLAAFALMALILVFGFLGAVVPALVHPIAWLIAPVLGVAALGGLAVLIWGLPSCAAAAWLFSYIVFRKA